MKKNLSYELEFNTLVMMSLNDNYYSNNNYEIIDNNDGTICINLFEVNTDTIIDLLYFNVLDVTDLSITISLKSEYSKFDDKSKIESEELYKRLYGYNMNPYLKCLILFITDAYNAQYYKSLLPNKLNDEIREFIESEN